MSTRRLLLAQASHRRAGGAALPLKYETLFEDVAVGAGFPDGWGWSLDVPRNALDTASVVAQPYDSDSRQAPPYVYRSRAYNGIRLFMKGVSGWNPHWFGMRADGRTMPCQPLKQAEGWRVQYMISGYPGQYSVNQYFWLGSSQGTHRIQTAVLNYTCDILLRGVNTSKALAHQVDLTYWGLHRLQYDPATALLSATTYRGGLVGDWTYQSGQSGSVNISDIAGYDDPVEFDQFMFGPATETAVDQSIHLGGLFLGPLSEPWPTW